MTTREAGKAGPVATATLIEAVRDVEAFMGAPSARGVRTPCACIRAVDYDALRAATLAVLDECIESLDCTHLPQDRGTLANARLLRERLRC